MLGRLLHSRARWALSFLVAVVAVPVLAADDPLIAAARAGDVSGVRKLVGERADVNMQSADGSTPLLWAAYNGEPEMVQALLEAGAKPDIANNYGVTPLLQASRAGDAAVIAALLEDGADATLGHPDGETPLMAAARVGQYRRRRAAAVGGRRRQCCRVAPAPDRADVGGGRGARSTSSTATGSWRRPEPAGSRYRVDGSQNARLSERRLHGADVGRAQRQTTSCGASSRRRGSQLTNGDGATAMMFAIVNDRFDLAATLVELGADVNDGSLYYAVEMRDATTDWSRATARGCARPPEPAHGARSHALLLEKGADPNKPFVGQMHSASMCCDTKANATPFYRAAVAADVEALKLMLAHGADFDWTPEHRRNGPQAPTTTSARRR